MEGRETDGHQETQSEIRPAPLLIYIQSLLQRSTLQTFPLLSSSCKRHQSQTSVQHTAYFLHNIAYDGAQQSEIKGFFCTKFQTLEASNG